jgi:ankyrin repeat protein
VKLLLENKADVEAHGAEYGSALQAASEKGHEQVVKLLLEENADVNAWGAIRQIKLPRIPCSTLISLW